MIPESIKYFQACFKNQSNGELFQNCVLKREKNPLENSKGIYLLTEKWSASISLSYVK